MKKQKNKKQQKKQSRAGCPRDARARRPRHGETREFDIVRAVPGDLCDLERIEAQCFDASVGISRRQFRYLLGSPGARLYVLRERGPADPARRGPGEGGAGSVAGDAIVLLRKGKTLVSSRVYSLAVAPEHRGKKFGRALMCHCLAELRKEGAADATLEVSAENTPAIALYESLGFVKARRLADYYGPGKDGWRMKVKFV